MYIASWLSTFPVRMQRQMSAQPSGELSPGRDALRIVLVYVVIGALWILLSDGLASSLGGDSATVRTIQTVKGWFYVLATGWLLYGLITRQLRRLHDTASRLRVSEEALATLLDNLPDAVIRVSPELGITYTNKMLTAEFGTPPDNSRSPALRTLTPDAGVNTSWMDAVDSVLRSGKPVTVEYAAPPGHPSLSLVSRCVPEYVAGRLTSVLCIVQNITSRRAAEEALRQSELRFSEFMEHSPALAFIKRPSGAYLYGNASWSAFHRLPHGRWGGIVDGELWAEPTMEAVQSRDTELIRTGTAQETVASCLLRRGDERWLHTMTFLLPDASGEPLIGGVALDITERLAAEQEVKLLNEQLERRVAERTRQLEEANAELEAFTFSVSHDLRAPLRSIGAFSTLLSKEHARTLSEEGRHFLSRVEESTQRMNDLIEGVLSLSRMSRTEIVREPVDLSRLARTILSDLSHTQPDRTVTSRVDDDMMASCDPRLVRVVLENLIGNAWKYSSRANPGFIEVGVRKNGESPVFYVRDNGVGFDMNHASRLFGAFQRLHSDREFPGTGVGLASVQRIIRRHGGRVWAEAEEGKGATFHFTLSGDS